MRPLLSVVIPVLREGQRLGDLLRGLDRHLKPRCYPYEVLVIDDNSRDGTEEAVKACVAEGIPAELHIRLRDRGRGSAVLFGLNRARGEILLVMNGNFSHPLEAASRLLDPFFQDPELEACFAALGPSFETEPLKSSYRGLLYRTFNQLLVQPLTDHPLRDPFSGLFAIRSQVFRRCAYPASLGFELALELILRCGCRRVKEIPLEEGGASPSRASWQKRLNHLSHLSQLYDFAYPRLSPSLKYLVTIGLGWILTLLSLLLCEWAGLAPPASVIVSYSGALLVSTAFFARYAHYNRGSFRSAHPYAEFSLTCLLEWMAVGGFLSFAFPRFPSSAENWVAFAIGVGATFRFVLRKLFAHDLRGPAQARHWFEQYRYREGGLECALCHGHSFSVPYVRSYPWLLRCSRCQVMFAHPQPTDEELGRIYNEQYYDEWGGQVNQEGLKAMKSRTFRRFVESLSDAGEIRSLLDIGCGLGYALDVGREKGWECHGIDFNPRAVEEVSRRHLDRVFCTSIENFQPNRTYDLVCLLDVLEHLKDPVETLRQLHRLIHADSLLLVTTIDANAQRARSQGSKWFHIHRAHLWYFNKASLSLLFHEAGYEPLLIDTASKSFNLRYVLGVLREKSGSRSWTAGANLGLRMLPGFLLNWPIPPLPEGIVVVARQRTRKEIPVYHHLGAGHESLFPPLGPL